MDNDQTTDLVEEIVEYLNEPAIKNRVRTAIERHGHELVRQEFSEMRTQALTRSGGGNPVKNPTGYFISLLKKLNDQDTRPLSPKSKSVFFETLEEHFNSMMITNVAKDDVVAYDAAMDAPYSGQGIPWPTGLGAEFFTLSTNKSKSDRVDTTIRLANGERFTVPMVRGKSFANDEERGIMTVEDNRLIKAMVIIWAEDHCQHTTGKVMKCFAKFSVRRLARTMGYTNFGGRDLVRLARRLSRLGTISYYIDLTDVPGLEHLGKTTYSIDFTDKPQIFDNVVDGHREFFVRITFSEFLSRMFIRRKTITRSKDMVLQKNELALLIQEYIESRVIVDDEKDGFRIALATLIERLHLPPAKWHKYKSKRRDQFEKALKELNGSTTWDGDTFFATIEDNKSGGDCLLRVKRVKIIDAPELPFDINTYTPKSKRYLAAREKAKRLYVGKFQRAAMGELALALRQFLALRRATDPE